MNRAFVLRECWKAGKLAHREFAAVAGRMDATRVWKLAGEAMSRLKSTSAVSIEVWRCSASSSGYDLKFSFLSGVFRAWLKNLFLAVLSLLVTWALLYLRHSPSQFRKNLFTRILLILAKRQTTFNGYTYINNLTGLQCEISIPRAIS